MRILIKLDKLRVWIRMRISNWTLDRRAVTLMTEAGRTSLLPIEANRVFQYQRSGKTPNMA